MNCYEMQTKVEDIHHLSTQSDVCGFVAKVFERGYQDMLFYDIQERLLLVAVDGLASIALNGERVYDFDCYGEMLSKADDMQSVAIYVIDIIKRLES